MDVIKLEVQTLILVILLSLKLLFHCFQLLPVKEGLQAHKACDYEKGWKCFEQKQMLEW